ncbi:hypothetical protein INT47_002924 [Mucor saturninus]|uniref:Uncharacterized protein n=1 Tax=Mucor saturninus TaxID=64648 RepID=A0A8H7QNS0_9FUNG|nr:hypothetical protein INT47_002924 [Mucor saturninus]
MTLDEHYICQRAANAIISEIGPFRVSTDALQAINQFLDEFIVLLLTCSLSLDLSNIKSVVFGLLPSTLGKNAIVEAELEVKTFTETESIDYELYERMRNLGTEGPFPLAEAVALLREKCFEYCTLADKDDQLYLQKSIRNKRVDETGVAISPLVAIYVTTVMEHIAEYLLTAVAMTAEHEDTDYVRVKEVFLALIDDVQLGNVFQRMDLRDKMEKRAGLFNLNTNKARNSYLPPPSPTPNRKSYINHEQQETGSFLDISFDDMDFDFEEDNRKSTASRIPDMGRPQSAMSHSSNYTLNNNNNNNRKSTYHLFKNNRNSFSSANETAPRASSPSSTPAAVYDPDAPSMDFDDLIKSGGTVKVSLTPNRLRSIEIKDQTKDELAPPPLTWERRSTSSPRLSAMPSRPSSPLVRQNTANSVRTTTSVRSASSGKTTGSVKTTHSVKKGHSGPPPPQQQQQHGLDPIEVPKLHARSASPSSPLSKSFSVHEKARFENPREAPPTPLSALNKSSPLPSTTASAVTMISTPSSVMSRSSESISSDISSVLSMPSPLLPMTTPVAVAVDTLAIVEPPLPKPTKSIPLNGMVLRRSSVSSRKSRENLRRAAREDTVEAPMPAPTPNNATTTVDAITVNATVTPNTTSTAHPNTTTTTNTKTTTTFTTTTTNTTNNNNNTTNTADTPAATPSQEVEDPTPTMILVSGGEEEPMTAEPMTLDRQVHFDQPPAATEVGAVIPRKKASTLSPERPSSMVAKRASMVGNRRRSLHESYATEKYHQDILLRQRVSNVGSVSVSIKQWDDIAKPEEQVNVIPPAAHRRSVLRQLRQQQLKEQLQIQQDLLQQVQEKDSSSSRSITPPLPATTQQQQLKGLSASHSTSSNSSSSNAVLDKVLKFERASSLDDDVSHQRVSHMPRRERFLYLQQDPSAIERKSTMTSSTKKMPSVVIRRIGIDQGVQTDLPPVTTTTTTREQVGEEEHGTVDGDEEWFLQDDEWDEQEETAMVEWLLGE